MKILVIGGVAGGATTAARLRREDEDSEIILFERGAYISYANCGLPYYIGGTIAERDNLFVQTPEQFSMRYNIDIRVLNEVISIDKENKELKIKDLKTDSIYTETYDKLVLSPGAEPIRPNLPGIDSSGIFTLRNVHDTDKIKNYIDSNKPHTAVVIGGGFIGLEMAENLHELGLSVCIVEMADQVMTPLDYSMASIVHQHLKVKQVNFHLQDGVSAFSNKDNKIIVHLKSGRELSTDLVILSIGVRADSKLAREAGLDIGVTGGIAVNEYLQTSNPDIYAIGDAIEYENPITHKKQITYLAGPANKQGRICADNIIHNNISKYNGSINTAIAKVFDLTVASTGVSARVLKNANIDYQSVIIHSGSHAGYYPGSIPMSIKIVFSKDNGKLFGAQIIGYTGVDKRIDVISKIIKSNGSIYDLTEFEHAYAPPYSSAKDPVNVAGFVAENILKNKVKIFSWREIENIDFNHSLIIDVRTKDEFELGAIPNAINIPIDEIRNRLSEIDKNKKIILYCGVGLRGYLACRILTQNDFTNVYNLNGGYKTYEFAIKKYKNQDIYENDSVGLDNLLYSKPNITQATATTTYTNSLKLNACGLQCPGPILKLKKGIEDINYGQTIEIQATDPSFSKDVESWSKITGNKIIELNSKDGIISAIIEKQAKEQIISKSTNEKNKTFVIFSDDLDKAIASFIIANGASTTGQKVTLFFTFWGLNIIKKDINQKVEKNFMGKMFSLFLPKNSKKLKLSKMQMFGMGPKMIRNLMKQKNVDSLESLIRQAHDNGVEFIACTMSMDLMEIKKEELFDFVEYGGVATYIERTESSNLNLFI